MPTAGNDQRTFPARHVATKWIALSEIKQKHDNNVYCHVSFFIDHFFVSTMNAV